MKEMQTENYKFYSHKECEFFPCHKNGNEESFNCLFCYCPLYHLDDCPGNPAYKEKNGRSIKVCTGCTFPHRAENYDKVVMRLKERDGR